MKIKKEKDRVTIIPPRKKVNVYDRPAKEKPRREIVKVGKIPEPIQNQISDDQDFFRNLKRENFKGIIMFRSVQSFNKWMDSHFKILSEKLCGRYHSGKKQFQFSWGAVLDFQVMQNGQDFSKLKGMRFNWMEVDDNIDPRIQQVAMSMIRNKLG